MLGITLGRDKEDFEDKDYNILVIVFVVLIAIIIFCMVSARPNSGETASSLSMEKKCGQKTQSYSARECCIACDTMNLKFISYKNQAGWFGYGERIHYCNCADDETVIKIY